MNDALHDPALINRNTCLQEQKGMGTQIPPSTLEKSGGLHPPESNLEQFLGGEPCGQII